MELKLTISKTDSDAPPEEEIYNTAHIRIGRHPQNDLHLENPFISRFHAEIIRRELGVYQLVCLKKDRAKINDKALEANRPVDLSDGDQIIFPGYTIGVNTIEEEETVELKKTDHTGTMLLKVKPGEKTEVVPGKSLDEGGTVVVDVKPRDKNEIHRLAKELAYKLRQVYANHFFETEEKKMEALKTCVNETCAAIVLPELRKEIFFFTNNLFQSPEQSDTFPSWIEDQRKNVAPLAIIDMAKDLNAPPPSQNEDREFEKFGHHWTAIIKLLLEALYKNIHFSREIKKEFEETMSAPLPSKANPLQNFTSLNRLSDYLLNWKEGEIKEISKNLQDLMEHMTIQQNDLPDNIHKEYQRIIDHLSPDTIEKEVNDQVDNSYIEKILLSKQKIMWKQFVEKHKQLSETMEKKMRALGD